MSYTLIKKIKKGNRKFSIVYNESNPKGYILLNEHGVSAFYGNSIDELEDIVKTVAVTSSPMEAKDEAIINTRLKNLRNLKKISQKELAEKSNVNIRMIQKYEQGDKDITKASVTTVYNLARALEVSIYELMGWEV